jgi:hypothetical protein
LKPGGWLCAQCGGHGNVERLMARIAELIAAEPQFAKYLRDYEHPWEFATAETAAERLQRAGFIEIETALQPAAASFATAEEYKQFLATVVLRTHVDRITSPNVREEFLEALTRRAALDNPAFELDYTRLNLRARRPA